MHVIKDNPYRILGVLSNSGARAIAANQGKLKAFLKTNRLIDFPNDFVGLLGTVDRTEDSVNKAISAISLPKDKLIAGFFWFMNENSIDEIALNNLRNGNIDKAIEVQRKKKTVAACINLAVMYLLKEDWNKAIYYYAHLLNSAERRNELLSIIADNANLMTELEVVGILCEELIRNFPKVDWYYVSRITNIEIDGEQVEIGDFLKESNISKYIAKNTEDKLVKDIETLLNKSKKTTCPEENLKLANSLKLKSHALLLKMKYILGKKDLRYKAYADKVANQVLNLCIDYYNSADDDSNSPRKVLPLTRYALRIAEGTETKERCQRNLDVIQEAYDALPPEVVAKEFEEIDFLINNYKKQNNRLLLVSCVQVCENLLGQIRQKLSASDKHYIDISSDVVHFVLGVIVAEVNKAQKAYNDAPEYLNTSEYNEYKSCLRWAKPIMDRLVNFAKDERCLKRFKENQATLNSLYEKHCAYYHFPLSQTTASPQSTASSRSTKTQHHSATTSRNMHHYTPHSAYNSPKRTASSNVSSNTWFSCFTVSAIIAIIAIICIITSSGHGSNSYPSYNGYDEDTIANDTIMYDDSNYSASDNSYDYEQSQSQSDKWLDKYRGNSLSTGATPYKTKYGGNSKSGNSALKVKAPLNCDVLVLIKNSYGNVVRHAYIKSGNSFSFKLRSGTYQPFFVFGKSWCPEEEAPNGEIGYFLEDVSISKDYPQEIGEYQELEYTLQTVHNGNFHAAYSNANEAF